MDIRTINSHRGRGDLARAVNDYLDKLRGMDVEKLRKQAERFIWLSAYAANNPRSDLHWKCDAVYQVCNERDLVSVYEDAHRKVSGQA